MPLEPETVWIFTFGFGVFVGLVIGAVFGVGLLLRPTTDDRCPTCDR